MGSVCPLPQCPILNSRFDLKLISSEHPYFDPKTNKDEPTWFMVSVKFLSRLPHPPSLALVKYLAASTEMPGEVDYIGEKGYKAVREMQLVNRGRLSMSRLCLPPVLFANGDER